jgi:hypothetical protein
MVLEIENSLAPTGAVLSDERVYDAVPWHSEVFASSCAVPLSLLSWPRFGG